MLLKKCSIGLAINNNGYVDFNDISLDYDSIVFSGVAGAVTIPSLIESYGAVKYSWKAKQDLKNKLKNSQTINRQNKLQDGIDKHNSIIWNNVYFQGSNKITQEVIKDNFIGESSNNE